MRVSEYSKEEKEKSVFPLVNSKALTQGIEKTMFVFRSGFAVGNTHTEYRNVVKSEQVEGIYFHF